MHQAVVGPQRCGAGPHLVIEIFGGLGIGRIALGAHVVVTIDLDQTDVTEPPLANDVVARFDQVRCAAALRSHLHDATVLARGGHHCLALDHVHADGLLTPHVGARLDCGAVEQELSAIHGSPPSNGCEYTSSHGRSNRRSPPPPTRPTLSSESDRNLAVDRPGYRRNSLVPVMPSRYKHI